MSAWGAPVSSAWANADAGEDELPAPLPTLGGKVEGQDEEAFPSLDAAAKAPSRKKKTTQKMSLTDFQSGKFQPKPKRELTQAEIRAMLPTAPLPKDQLEAQEAAPNASGAYNRYGESKGGAVERFEAGDGGRKRDVRREDPGMDAMPTPRRRRRRRRRFRKRRSRREEVFWEGSGWLTYELLCGSSIRERRRRFRTEPRRGSAWIRVRRWPTGRRRKERVRIRRC